MWSSWLHSRSAHKPDDVTAESVHGVLDAPTLSSKIFLILASEIFPAPGCDGEPTHSRSWRGRGRDSKCDRCPIVIPLQGSDPEQVRLRDQSIRTSSRCGFSPYCSCWQHDVACLLERPLEMGASEAGDYQGFMSARFLHLLFAFWVEKWGLTRTVKWGAYSDSYKSPSCSSVHRNAATVGCHNFIFLNMHMQGWPAQF